MYGCSFLGPRDTTRPPSTRAVIPHESGQSYGQTVCRNSARAFSPMGYLAFFFSCSRAAIRGCTLSADALRFSRSLALAFAPQ